jgi:hypothetical protein
LKLQPSTSEVATLEHSEDKQMRTTDRKIPDYGRGLGAALTIVMADAGPRLILLGRIKAAL